MQKLFLMAGMAQERPKRSYLHYGPFMKMQMKRRYLGKSKAEKKV